MAQAQHQACLCYLSLKASSQPSRWGAAGPSSRALARLAADTGCSQQGELVIWLESPETRLDVHGKGCQIKLMLDYMLLWFSFSGKKVEETLHGQWAPGGDPWDASGFFNEDPRCFLGLRVQAFSLSVETAGCLTQWESCFTTAGPLCSASVLLITS